MTETQNRRLPVFAFSPARSQQTSSAASLTHLATIDNRNGPEPDLALSCNVLLTRKRDKSMKARNALQSRAPGHVVHQRRLMRSLEHGGDVVEGKAWLNALDRVKLIGVPRVLQSACLFVALRWRPATAGDMQLRRTLSGKAECPADARPILSPLSSLCRYGRRWAPGSQITFLLTQHPSRRTTAALQ